MKKKKILNTLMVAVIAVIAVSGIMAVKSLKGATVPQTGTETQQTNTEEQTVPFIVADKSGIVTVERKGIAYEVDNNTTIKNGDILRTKVSSEISFAENGKNVITLGANTTVKVTDVETMTLELVEGEVFADHRNTQKTMSVTAENSVFTPIGTTFTVTAYKSAATVYVYSGSVSVSGDKISEIVTAEKGKLVNVVTDQNGDVTAEERYYSVNFLSDWQIAKLQKCGMDNTFNFTAEDLNNVVEAREEENAAAQQAKILLEQQAKDELANEQKEYDEAYQQYLEAIENGAKAETDANGNIVVTAPPKYVTIEIRCDTILDNMGDLKEGKEGYVPANGTILSKSKIALTEGETAFDITKKACKMAGIQIEYSWTPMYNSYYVEGINNLYEFDCGAESGWMYKVNGWYPNYGSSSYELEEDDVIVWTYTCKGLGADVGGSVYG